MPGAARAAIGPWQLLPSRAVCLVRPDGSAVVLGDVRFEPDDNRIAFRFEPDKKPREFGARLWNGVIYKMAITDEGIVGTPQVVDLNLIGAPPSSDAPTYGMGERADI